MTIQELAYSAQQHLQVRTGHSFKRSHVYELLAASFAYNSYAAFNAEAVFTQRSAAERPDTQQSFIRQRCVVLGYPAAIAEVVSSELTVFISEKHIDAVRLSDLVAELRGESSQEDEYQPDDSEEQLEEDSEDVVESNEGGVYEPEISPILLSGLETAAGKGNALAHYALALIYEPDEDDEAQGSSYWYSQAQAGRVLSGVEKEWADTHARQLAESEKYAFHLREAGRLSNEHALLDLADRFDDPTFFERAHIEGAYDPMRVADIAERLHRIDDVRHWLTVAAESGDTNAMRRLIEEFDHQDLQRCWTWLYLSKLVGTELNKSNHRAIHDDGSPYDDDVGGTVHVVGEDGIELEALAAQQDAATRQAAEELFERIRKVE